MLCFWYSHWEIVFLLCVTGQKQPRGTAVPLWRVNALRCGMLRHISLCMFLTTLRILGKHFSFGELISLLSTSCFFLYFSFLSFFRCCRCKLYLLRRLLMANWCYSLANSNKNCTAGRCYLFRLQAVRTLSDTQWSSVWLTVVKYTLMNFNNASALMDEL